MSIELAPVYLNDSVLFKVTTYDADGVTLLTPLSCVCSVYNRASAAVVINGLTGTVGSGYAQYNWVGSGSAGIFEADLVVTLSPGVIKTERFFVEVKTRPLAAVSVTNGYATIDEFNQRFIPNNTTQAIDYAIIANVITAVSRLIDRYCQRRFYRNSNDETRTFTAQSPVFCRVDDLGSVTTLKIDSDGDRTYETTLSSTQYGLMPSNASLDTEPYTHVSIAPNGSYRFPVHALGVQIVGKFGYSASTPQPINEACLLQTLRLFKRKDAPFGIVGSAEMGQQLVIARLDPDVEFLIKHFKRNSGI